MTSNDLKLALAEAQERIRWAGNLYGKDWRKEVNFLEPAAAALMTAIRMLPHRIDAAHPELPPDGVTVLVQFSGRKNGCTYDHAEMLARYHHDTGWAPEYFDIEDYVVHAWAHTPEFRNY